MTDKTILTYSMMISCGSMLDTMNETVITSEIIKSSFSTQLVMIYRPAVMTRTVGTFHRTTWSHTNTIVLRCSLAEVVWTDGVIWSDAGYNTQTQEENRVIHLYLWIAEPDAEDWKLGLTFNCFISVVTNLLISNWLPNLVINQISCSNELCSTTTTWSSTLYKTFLTFHIWHLPAKQRGCSCLQSYNTWYYCVFVF